MTASITKRLNLARSMLDMMSSTEYELRLMAEMGRAVDVFPAAFLGQGMAAHPYDLDDVANDLRRLSTELRRMAAKMYADTPDENGIDLSLFPGTDKPA